jgi:hypothetical protein
LACSAADAHGHFPLLLGYRNDVALGLAVDAKARKRVTQHYELLGVDPDHNDVRVHGCFSQWPIGHGLGSVGDDRDIGNHVYGHPARLHQGRHIRVAGDLVPMGQAFDRVSNSMKKST